jgi:catecholate siderophore receptor
LLLTPAGSGSLWSTYRLPVGQGLTLGGGIRFTGSAFINAANTIELPAFHLVDALAEYPVNAFLSLRLNVSNVTNERYIRSINNNGGRYNPGTPRSAAVTLRVRY